jgi:hypothetical protein
MLDAAGTLPVFTLQNKANLTGLMRMFLQSKAGRHESFGNANPVQLTGAQLRSETVRSPGVVHVLDYRSDTARRPYKF